MEEGRKVVVTQVRGKSGRDQRVKDTLTCLGLTRVGKPIEHTLNPAIIGMISKVRHLVSVRYVKE